MKVQTNKNRHSSEL